MAVDLGKLPSPGVNVMGQAMRDAQATFVPGRLATLVAGLNNIQEQATKADALALQTENIESQIADREGRLALEQSKIAQAERDALERKELADTINFIKTSTTTTLGSVEDLNEVAQGLQALDLAKFTRNDLLEKVEAAKGVSLLGEALSQVKQADPQTRISILENLEGALNGSFGSQFLLVAAQHPLFKLHLSNYAGKLNPQDNSPIATRERAVIGSIIKAAESLSPQRGQARPTKASQEQEIANKIAAGEAGVGAEGGVGGGSPIPPIPAVDMSGAGGIQKKIVAPGQSNRTNVSIPEYIPGGGN